jgi:hypothetical protein
MVLLQLLQAQLLLVFLLQGPLRLHCLPWYWVMVKLPLQGLGQRLVELLLLLLLPGFELLQVSSLLVPELHWQQEQWKWPASSSLPLKLMKPAGVVEAPIFGWNWTLQVQGTVYLQMVSLQHAA